MSVPTHAHLKDALKSQVRLRMAIAFPMIVVAFGIYTISESFPAAIEWVTAAYVGYTLLTLALAMQLPARLHSGATYATAVADAAFVTAWMLVLNDASPLIAAFYLFSLIGYGTRSGRRYMFTYQVVALAGLASVLYLDSYWRTHPLNWLGLTIPVLIIPLYLAPLFHRLRTAIDHAEAQSRAKSDLLARVSHELRTPLAGIVSAAELMRAKAPSHGTRQLTDTMLELSQHLLAEINDLLDEAKYEANALVLAPTPCDLHTVGETVRAALQSQARQKGLVFEVLVDSRVQQPVIADSHYLSRVIMNLAGNAVKFTERGGVAVRIALLDSSLSSCLLRFSVEDTGPGIAPADQSRVFEPFVQLPQTKHHVGGTGLGLTLSKDLVTLMGGRLLLSSEVGSGSRFWFDLRLPVAALAARPEVAASVSTSIEPKRVLLVDDNLTNLHLLREVLMMDGHKVATADCGKDALELLQNGGEWDVVFLDFNLPDMTGASLLQTYRFGTSRPAPVYFLTADASPVTRVALEKSGAIGVLTKPIRTDEIRAAIARAAAGTTSAQDSRDAAPTLRAVPVLYVDAAVIDRLAGISRRPTFVAEMIERAVADINRNVRELGDAFSAGDWERSRDAAHALKGVAQEIGAVRLANLAISIMRSSATELGAGRERLAEELNETTVRTVAALAGFANSPQPLSTGTGG